MVTLNFNTISRGMLHLYVTRACKYLPWICSVALYGICNVILYKIEDTFPG